MEEVALRAEKCWICDRFLGSKLCDLKVEVLIIQLWLEDDDDDDGDDDDDDDGDGDGDGDDDDDDDDGDSIIFHYYSYCCHGRRMMNSEERMRFFRH